MQPRVRDEEREEVQRVREVRRDGHVDVRRDALDLGEAGRRGDGHVDAEDHGRPPPPATQKAIAERRSIDLPKSAHAKSSGTAMTTLISWLRQAARKRCDREQARAGLLLAHEPAAEEVEGEQREELLLLVEAHEVADVDPVRVQREERGGDDPGGNRLPSRLARRRGRPGTRWPPRRARSACAAPRGCARRRAPRRRPGSDKGGSSCSRPRACTGACRGRRWPAPPASRPSRRPATAGRRGGSRASSRRRPRSPRWPRQERGSTRGT